MTNLVSSLVVRLIDDVTGPAGAISKSLGSLTDSMGSDFGSGLDLAIKRNNASLVEARAGLVDVAAGIFALGKAGSAPISLSADFQTSMNQVSAVSGAVGNDLEALRQQALELGRTTQFTTSQAADAMGFLAMAGFDADQILGAMPGTLQLAASAQMDMARAADVVTNILTGYNKEVSELPHVNDVLVKTFTSANTDLVKLAEAMKYAGPVASAAGVEFEEAAASLALMGNAGIQGSMAGTSLRGAISRILAPTKKVRDIMKEAGLSFSDAGGKLLPLADIIEQLEPHADDAGMFMELFGQRAGPALAALVSQGADAVRELQDELKDSTGTAARIAAIQMQGFNGQMKELESASEGALIAIGDALIPSLGAMTDKITEVILAVTPMLEAYPELTAAVLGTTAAFVGFRVAVAGVKYLGLLGKGGALAMLSIGFNTVGKSAIGATNAFRNMVAYQSALASMSGTSLSGLQKVGAGLRGVALAIPGIAPLGGVLTAVGGALAGVSAPVWGAIAVAVAAVAGAGALLWKYWDRVTSVLGGVAARIGEELKPAIDLLQPVLAPLGDAARAVGDGFNWAGEQIGSAMNWLGQFFEREELTDGQKAEWEAVGYNVIDGILTGMKSMFLGVLEWFGSWPGEIMKAIGSIDISGLFKWRFPWDSPGEGGPSLGNATINGQTTDLPSPTGHLSPSGHRATGGDVWPGGSFVVGDGGEPEIFSPKTAGTITPLSKVNGTGPISIGPFYVTGSDPITTAREVQRLIRDEYLEMLHGGYHDQGVFS